MRQSLEHAGKRIVLVSDSAKHSRRVFWESELAHRFDIHSTEGKELGGSSALKRVASKR